MRPACPTWPVPITSFAAAYLLSTHADRQGVDISFKVRSFVCLFVCVCVCTVTDFSGEDKASGVKLCTMVHRRPGKGISHFGEHCSPETQNCTNRPPPGSIA